MTLAALLAEHVELCQAASGAAAQLSDLLGSCQEHPKILEEDCEACAPIVAAALKHSRLAHQAGLVQQRIEFERQAERSRAELASLQPAAPRPRRQWRQITSRAYSLVSDLRVAAAMWIFAAGLWLGRLLR